MSDSVPKSASEVAEQAVRVHPDGDGYYDVVFGGMIAELGNEQSANIIASGLRRQLTTLLDSYATERISADRREREKGYDAKEVPPPKDREFLAYVSNAAYVLMAFCEGSWVDDSLSAWSENQIVRWWPLPGPADAKEER